MFERRMAFALAGGIAAAGCGGAPGWESPEPEPGVHEAARPTGAVSSVTEREMRDGGSARIEEVLQGRVAGLRVLRLPNGGYSLRIRGAGSLRGDGEPLLVIDGMTIPPGTAASALAGLSPREVARVDVLKDAGSTAFYGSRGANGVIVITTRK